MEISANLRALFEPREFDWPGARVRKGEFQAARALQCTPIGDGPERNLRFNRVHASAIRHLVTGCWTDSHVAAYGIAIVAFISRSMADSQDGADFDC